MRDRACLILRITFLTAAWKPATQDQTALQQWSRGAFRHLCATVALIVIFAGCAGRKSPVAESAAADLQAQTQSAFAKKSLSDSSKGFGGAWKAKFCDKGNPSAVCGSLNLYLYQNGYRLCGRHSAATIGLNQVDEGQPRSIVGAVIGATAIVTLASGRNDGIYLAKLQRDGPRMEWEILEDVREPLSKEGIVISPKALLDKREYQSELKKIEGECSQK